MQLTSHKVRRPRSLRNRGRLLGRARFARALALLLPLVALACGDDRAVDPAPVPVETVTVAPADLTLLAGETASLQAVTRSAAGAVLPDRPITWSAAPAGIVTVTATGALTAQAAGVAIVTATSEGKSGTARVVVQTPSEEPPPPQRPSITALSPAQITDGWGEAFTLTITGERFAPGAIAFFGGSPLETQFVSATEVRARITPAQVALVGQFAITVANPPLPAELVSAPATFTVVPRIPATVRVTPTRGYPWVWAEDWTPFEARALDLAGRPLPNRTPTWASEQPGIARVTAQGFVRGVSPGDAAITATVDGVQGRASVRVYAAPAFDLVWNHGTARARRLVVWSPGTNTAPQTLQTSVTAYDPSPSPDGRRIAFTGIGADGNVDVYVVRRDGTGLVRLTTADGIDDMPAWSPDGTRIAFRSTRAGRSDIWVMDADGGNATRLTAESTANGGAPSGDPAWSPDGAWLAYAQGTTLDRDIWIMRADGSAKRRLASGAEDEREPTWSPNGQVIAYRSGAEGAGAQILMRSVEDGSLVWLIFYPGAGATPAYSPDGRWLAYSRATDAGQALHVMPLDGSMGDRTVFAPTLDAGANAAWMRR